MSTTRLSFTYSIDLKDKDGTSLRNCRQVIFVARKDWFEAQRPAAPGGSKI